MTQELKVSNTLALSGGKASPEAYETHETHLQRHGHLTNNIHLRNLLHMQRQRVLMEARNSSELPLMKELTILRRARSLRDPSTSPAWSNSSYGSRRVQGNNKKRDETKEMKGEANRRGVRSANDGARREKLDLRVGGRHWVGEFLEEEDGVVDQVSLASDQKENNVLTSNGMRDEYSNHQSFDEDETKSVNRGSLTNQKGSRSSEKSRIYPRLGAGQVEGDEDEHSVVSRPRSGRSSDQHSERANMAEESIAGARVTEDDRLQRGSGRGGAQDDGRWVEEPGKKARNGKRTIISERKKNGEAGRGEVSLHRLSSPAYVPKPPLSHRGQHSMEAVSVMDLATEHDSDGDEALPQGEGTYGDSEEDAISLQNGLKQLPSSLSSHTQSPLLYRDSMTQVVEEERPPRPVSRKKSSKGSRDFERRHREGINVRVPGKAQGRLRGRRAIVRQNNSPGAFSTAGGELEVSELPRNGCGIPWHWTRMHQKYRGRKFLDIAGRSLSCGSFSDSAKRKDAKVEGKEQSRTNSQRDFAQVCHSLSLDQSGLYPSRHLDGAESPEIIPRADGNLLTVDRSGELVFNSTREDLSFSARDTLSISGILMPTSPDYGADSLARTLSIRAPEDVNRSLSQKYRPKTFSELVGQAMVTTSLNTAAIKGKIAPVYLFQGPCGTGKTSAARIFARAVNCVSDSLELARPCGVCSVCEHPGPDIKEFNAASNKGVDSVKSLLASLLTSASTARYKVFIIDDCHLLSTEIWNTFVKAMEVPPWRVVFILITSEGDKVPRSAISRCQKFLFSKIKEAEIVSRLQTLAAQEGIEVEEPALALVAARSQGSLRDAEMILDQLSLLGRNITLPTVQEMAGLISEDKLVDLLDLAMSAEAVDTVRCMRELLDGGIEPLSLVSQLATLITDILAGTYVVSREKVTRKFFFKRSSRKDEAVRLRQALKILFEAEKQLRQSSDQPTWLTAALLQFAPDRSFQPSSLETSLLASPIAAFHDTSEKETVGDSVQPWTSEEQISILREKTKSEPAFVRDLGYPNFLERRKKHGTLPNYAESKIHPAASPVVSGLGSPADGRASGRPSNARSDTPLLPGSLDDLNQREFTVMSQRKLQEVWQRVLQGSRSNVLRQLLQGQGKLLSLLLSDAFAVAHVEFRHPDHKARAERSRSRICNAFQMALGCPVELQITLACMPGEQQNSFTSVEDIPQFFEGWHKEKSKTSTPTPDGRSYETRQSHNRRRQRSTRPQPPPEALDIPQSLYNAVMGDSKGFKPEILPVVSSTKWGRHGGPEENRLEERSERPRDPRKVTVSLTHDLRHSGTLRARYGGPGQMSRPPSGKVPLKTVIQQTESNAASPNQEPQTDVLCGSGSNSRKKGGRPSGHQTGLEQENPRLETRLKPSQTESRLLCWRVQKLDEEKIKVQRRRRQRRGAGHPSREVTRSKKPAKNNVTRADSLQVRDSPLVSETWDSNVFPVRGDVASHRDPYNCEDNSN